jgi:hypothetical protein
MKKASYKRLMIFLDGFIVVVVAFFSQNLVMLTFKVGPTISHIISFSRYFWWNKTSWEITKLHLHYNVNPVLLLQAQNFVIPIFIIGLQFSNSIPKFDNFTNNKKRIWNWDKGWIGYGTREDFVNNFNIHATFKGFF